jgi:hypothetical protein
LHLKLKIVRLKTTFLLFPRTTRYSWPTSSHPEHRSHPASPHGRENDARLTGFIAETVRDPGRRSLSRKMAANKHPLPRHPFTMNHAVTGNTKPTSPSLFPC